MQPAHIATDSLDKAFLTAEEPPFPLRVSNPQEWRPIVPERRTSCSHCNIESLGNFVPLWTDGILVLALIIHSGEYVHVQLSAVVWPKKERQAGARSVHKPSTRTKKHVRVQLTLEDFLF